LRDHPRIRGEHGPNECCRDSNWGSSPHTRGAPRSRVCLSTPTGIIPAYAGSTLIRGGDGRDTGDHPRIRGEHKAKQEAAAKEMGSSPHTRGARSRFVLSPPRRGIIPAYAGSTP